MKAWKALFWLVLIFFILDLVKLPFSKNPGINDMISLFISGFSLMPIYGYAYQIGIGNKIIATIIFSINALGMAAANYFGMLMLLEEITRAQIILTIIALAISFIYLFPQFMYAFKSNHLWNQSA